MSDDKLHIHVVNDPDIPVRFVMSEDEVWEALKGDRKLMERVALTIGWKDDRGTKAVDTAAVLVGHDFDRDFVASARNLRWIHILGAGVEHLVPLDWLPRGVAVTNSSGAHVKRASEFAACALLMLSNRVPEHITSMRQHRWAPRYSFTADSRVVVIFGVGRIGCAVAKQAKQLGLEVRGIRRSGRSRRSVDRMFPADQLHEALRGADYLIVAAPLTSETRQIIGAAELDLLQPGGGVVNLARADIVDVDALVKRLQDGRLGGAVLDVFDPEPLPEDSPLWDVPNAILTPHVSLDSVDYNRLVLEIFAKNLSRLLEGKVMCNRVSLRRGY